MGWGWGRIWFILEDGSDFGKMKMTNGSDLEIGHFTVGAWVLVVNIC